MANPLIAIINNRELISKNIINPGMQGSLLLAPYANVTQHNYIGIPTDPNEPNVPYYYEKSNKCITKWYVVVAKTPYLIMASANPGTAFRWAFSEDEISEAGEFGSPDSVYCEKVFCKDSPEPFFNVIYTPKSNGYLGGTIDTNGKYDTQVYVFDLLSITK